MTAATTPAIDSRRSKKSTKGLIVVVVMIASVVAFFIIKNQDPIERWIPKRWGVVEDGYIYRSGQLHAALVKRTWEDHDIEVVINMGVDKPDRPDHTAAIQAAEDLGIDRVFFHLGGDGTGDPEMYVGALTTLIEARRAGKPVVVHCFAGSYRTGGVVALYRMLVEGWSREDALREMFDYGVRERYDAPILPYLDEHLPWIRQRLVENGVIEGETSPPGAGG